MNQPQNPPIQIPSGATPVSHISGPHRSANESVYQVAIIIVALLLVISASLF